MTPVGLCQLSRRANAGFNLKAYISINAVVRMIEYGRASTEKIRTSREGVTCTAYIHKDNFISPQKYKLALTRIVFLSI